MKMSDVFTAKLFAIDNEDITGEDAPCLCHKGGGYYAVFNTGQQAQAAAHAINQHDALVAMNAELVEALGNILWDVCQDDEPDDSLTHLALASGTLRKAKELSQ